MLTAVRAESGSVGCKSSPVGRRQRVLGRVSVEIERLPGPAHPRPNWTGKSEPGVRALILRSYCMRWRKTLDRDYKQRLVKNATSRETAANDG